MTTNGIHRALILFTAVFVSRSFFAAESRAERVDEALARGVGWLSTQQNPDGGFGPTDNPRSPKLKGVSDVGLSAFCLYALARVPPKFRQQAVLEKAVTFLLSKQQPDGSFYDPLDPSLQNYKTSVAVLALVALDRVKHHDAISKAVKFIKSQQISDGLNEGGIGYGSRDKNPDLSNTQFALEALHEAGESPTDSVYERAQRFLTKVQNLKGAEPIPLPLPSKDGEQGYRKSSGDGGFVYRIIDTRGAEETLDGMRVFSSYGSMTYAGLKSLLYAQVGPDDERVKAAFEWISKNFTVEKNPGMPDGQQGLFYYYHTMAKALAVYGERLVIDGTGRRHDWAVELGEQLVRRQHKQGFWINDADRWMEKIPQLATSYALVSLTVCKEATEK